MRKKMAAAAFWILPAGLIAVGIMLYTHVPTSFLGLICFGLAVLACLYYGIHKLSGKDRMLGKCLHCVLSVLLCFGLVVVAVTGLFVGRAAIGQADQEAEYIVVLGAKVNGTQPSQILSQRINAAYAYLVANPGTVAVLSGGQGADEGISEAQCMFDRLTAMGIEPERLWLEEDSTSTEENLVFSLFLMEYHTGTRPEKIGIVSSEFHMFRAELFAQECGVEAVRIPGWTDNPLYFVNYFLREIAGVWHYILLGG